MASMPGMDHMAHSGGAVMYMDGFRFTLAGNFETQCLNLFFPSWTLNTKGKFVAAMFGVTALAIATEGISALRLRLHKSMVPGTKRKATIMAMHGFQAFMGYMIMMVTMTFSVELLLCVVLGLGIGYGIFFDDATASHVTTNPCCSFMEDEALDFEEDEQVMKSGAAVARKRPSEEEDSGLLACPCSIPESGAPLGETENFQDEAI